MHSCMLVCAAILSAGCDFFFSGLAPGVCHLLSHYRLNCLDIVI